MRLTGTRVNRILNTMQQLIKECQMRWLYLCASRPTTRGPQAKKKSCQCLRKGTESAGAGMCIRGVHSLSALQGIYTQLSICVVIELIQKYRVIFPLNKELCTHKCILVYLRLLPLHVLQNEPISYLRVASINL